MNAHTAFTYDEYGQLLSAAFGESIANTTAIATEHYQYDTYGNLTQYTDPLGHTTQFAAFDALGNAHTITDARGQRWQRRFDATGSLLSDDPHWGERNHVQ